MSIVDVSRPDLLMGAKQKKQRDPEDWKFSEKPECIKATAVKLPKKCNIKSKFGKVYAQRYGNCTSNAVLGCDAYYYHDSTKDPNWEPSTTFTYYNQRKMDGDDMDVDDGSLVKTGLRAVKKYGACNSKVWSNDEPFNKKPSVEAYENGLKGHEITKYYAINSFLQLKKALYAKYPVAASMLWPFGKVDNQTWILVDPTDKEIKKCCSAHAIIIVGYDDINKLIEIRNSWGENWCNKGYAYITYDSFKKCMWYTDSYAITK